jgi:predicted Zn-dependent protease with MMP-like domain
MFARLPAGPRIAASALVAFCIAILIVTLLGGLSSNYLERLAQVIACSMAAIVVLGAVITWITGRLADYQEPADEDEFEALVRRSELLARENLAAEPDEIEFMTLDPRDPRDFETLVREALDDLPDLLIKSLDHVAVVISDKGRKQGAYGLYQSRPPDTVPREKPGLIVIFRDTLLRDFGDDPDELRAQVTRTVRHELAHHLGADELGVRELGL